MVPYQKENQAENPDTPLSFDILQLMSDVDDDELIMAVAQVEGKNEDENVITSCKTALVMKKVSPKKQHPTFNNCTLGSIGTLNINIYKK